MVRSRSRGIAAFVILVVICSYVGDEFWNSAVPATAEQMTMTVRNTTDSTRSSLQHLIARDNSTVGSRRPTAAANAAAATGDSATISVPTGQHDSAGHGDMLNLPSNCPTDDVLEFVHIRKTGGTAIERALKKAGLQPFGHFIKAKRNVKAMNRRPGSGKHVPPRYYIYTYRRSGGSRTLPKSVVPPNVRFFAVVRNPYDRAISEYYQHFKYNNELPDGIPSANDADFMNRYIQANMEHADRDLFIPQYEYIYDAHGNRIVHHVLHFESMRREFQALMDCYYNGRGKKGVHHDGETGPISVTLPERQVNKRQDGASLTRKNLTKESMAVINKVEKLAFEKFGYPMIPATRNKPP